MAKKPTTYGNTNTMVHHSPLFGGDVWHVKWAPLSEDGFVATV